MDKLRNFLTVVILISIISGLSSSLFLWGLVYVTQKRVEWPYIIILLPLFSIIQNWCNHKFQSINISVPDVLKSTEAFKQRLNPLGSIFVFVSSLGTHLFGGSAGREGVGLIMSSTIADGWLKKFTMYERSSIIRAALAAGFSSMFSTPLAGVVFAFEITEFKKKDLFLLLYSSLGATFVTHLLKAPHTFYKVSEVYYDFKLLRIVMILGFIIPLACYLFYYLLAAISYVGNKFSNYKFLIAMLSTSLIVLIVYQFKLTHLQGIGIDHIQKSFEISISQNDWWLKILLTILTIGVGLKGGEVTPLFFIGATTANAIGQNFIGEPLSLWTSVGFVVMFATMYRAPLTSVFIATELFSPWLALPIYLSTLVSLMLYRKRSLYRL